MEHSTELKHFFFLLFNQNQKARFCSLAKDFHYRFAVWLWGLFSLRSPAIPKWPLSCVPSSSTCGLALDKVWPAAAKFLRYLRQGFVTQQHTFIHHDLSIDRWHAPPHQLCFALMLKNHCAIRSLLISRYEVKEVISWRHGWEDQLNAQY